MSQKRIVDGVDERGRPRARWEGAAEDGPRYGFMEPAHTATIERRTATPEELEAARAREAEPDPLRVRSSTLDALPMSPNGRARPPTRPEEELAVVDPVADLPTAAADISSDLPPAEPVADPAHTGSPIDVLALAAARGYGGWDAASVLVDALLELIEADTDRTMAQTRWINARIALDQAYRALDGSSEAPADTPEIIPEPVARAAAITSAYAAKAPRRFDGPTRPGGRNRSLMKVTDEEIRAAIAAHSTRRQAARALDISEATLYARLKRLAEADRRHEVGA